MVGAAGTFGGIAPARPDQRLSPSSALPPPPPSTQVPFLTIVGPTGRLLVYNPALLTGDLLASIAARSFNDGAPGGGNQVLQGISSYTPGGTGLAPIVQINFGTIQFWQLAPGSAGLVNPALIGINGATGNDALIIQSPQNTGHNQASILLQAAFPVAQISMFGAVLYANQSNTPGSSVGFATLYADSFGQLHTDRAFQTDVNVEIKNLGASPGAGGSGAKSWSSSGHRQIQAGQAGIGGDGLNYDVEHLDILTPNPSGAGQIINNVLTTILQKTIGIGTYHVRGCISYVGNQAGGVPTLSVTFPAVSNNTHQRLTYTVMNNGATQPVPGFSRSNTGISVAGPTLVLNQFVAADIDITLTTTAAGAFTVSGQSSILGDTFTIQALSYLDIQPIVAT